MRPHRAVLSLVLGLTGPVAAADSQNPNTDWFRDAGRGLFMHVLPGNAAQLALLDRFDTDALARQAEAAGAKYLVLTLGQNSGYFIAPNATYDRFVGWSPGERCARRDLPLDLHRALQPKGIRLMLYLPCQTPNGDARAQRAFGLPEGPKDQPLDTAFAAKWAQVIQEWSDHYGDKVSGWWFDGGYAWVRFNDSIARLYADAVKHGNPRAIVTFNPGVLPRMIRHTAAEDYTAGELNDPFPLLPTSRWVDGSQWHALTFLGSNWGARDTRHPDSRWSEWIGAVTKNGGVVTLDVGPNWDPAAGPIGAISPAQQRQLEAIQAALTPARPHALYSTDRDFPIAVWLQNPRNAERYKAAGINLYVGLWRGPTPEQLATLERAGMRVICAQNRAGLEHKDNPIIVGWMHDDEPDNAQSLGEGKGYGPPILPAVIVRDYERMRAADPSRPVLLNLGQGVAWDDYIGRGVRRRHPEDYPEYIQGADIVSFDIYPVVHESPEVTGRLEFVARGVERLIEWAGGRKTVWNCIECTHIGNPKIKATPAQVRAEVWMALVRGSRGLIYFVHQFEPEFREAALLDDPEMLAGVTAINREIRELAPVLSRPTETDAVTVQSPGDDTPVATLVKRHEGALYLFAVSLRNRPTRATFTLRAPTSASQTEVLEESRVVPLEGGRWADEFAPYAVHLYRVAASSAGGR